MTAKRFNYENDKIIDDIGHRCIIAFAYSEENAKVLCEMLNEINDENEQLKSLNKYLIELLEQNGATVEIEKVKMND